MKQPASSGQSGSLKTYEKPSLTKAVAMLQAVTAIVSGTPV